MCVNPIISPQCEAFDENIDTRSSLTVLYPNFDECERHCGLPLDLQNEVASQRLNEGRHVPLTPAIVNK